MRVIGALAATLLLAVVVLSPGGPSARANGVPQLVKLTYLDGVSTWGPHEAEGVLEFSFAEAYARVDVKNLVPQPGLSYEGWMVAPSGEAYRVGEIPVSQAGIGTLETKLTGLEGYDYNLFLVVGRDGNDAADRMPDRRSIAGRFTIINDVPGQTAISDVRPGLLPDAGERAPDTTSRRIALWGSTAMAVGGLGIVAHRILRRRNAK